MESDKQRKMTKNEIYKKYKNNFTKIILKENKKNKKKCIGELCGGIERPLYAFDKKKDGTYKSLCKGCDAIRWIEKHLKLYKSKWKGKPFKLMLWEKLLIYDIFGTIKPNGLRQYKEVYIEVPKKNGKTPLMAAIGAKLFFNDHENGAEIYAAACDKEQARLTFQNIICMIEQNRTLGLKCKILESTKRIKHNNNPGAFLRVVSSDSKTSHGIDVHGLLFDEIHAQPNRELYDVLTKGSGDAREQPLFIYITTAGWDRNSICYQLHNRALRTIDIPENDPTFYGVVFSIDDDDDWTDEKIWEKANPSLHTIIDIQAIRDACKIAKQSPADENFFRRMRLNQWVKQESRYIPMIAWDKCGKAYDPKQLKITWAAGLDIASVNDIAAYELVGKYEEKYYSISYFWIPEDNVEKRVKDDHVPYDNWISQGLMKATPGNIIDQKIIESDILKINSEYQVQEIGYDRWGAVRMAQNFTDLGITMVPISQSFAGMGAATAELLKLILAGEFRHNGNHVLRWMADNLVVKTDDNNNHKPDKKKSTEKIDGMVSLIMGLDRCIRLVYGKKSKYEEEMPEIIGEKEREKELKMLEIERVKQDYDSIMKRRYGKK